MSFKLYKCKGPAGLPLVEVPDGSVIAERLTPGEIREADYYDLFRRVKRGGANILVACPRNKVRGGRCAVPLRVLRVWHKREGLKSILRDCDNGALFKRRRRAIETILKDIKEAGGPSFSGLSETTGRTFGQSVLLISASLLAGLLLHQIVAGL